MKNYLFIKKKNYSLRYYTFLKLQNNLINKKIIMYLLLDLLINQKYIQFFYINKLYFNNLIDLNISKLLYIYILSQLEEDQNYILHFIQCNFFYNIPGKFRFKYERSSFFSFNRRLYSRNQLNNSFFLHHINIKNWYKNIIYSNYTWLIYSYMFMFFNSDGLSLRYKSMLTMLKVHTQYHTYNILNYYLIKQMFKIFINIIINSLIYNHIPFFVCSKNLENDVLLLYSFFLYIKTSILFKSNNLKYIVNFRKISKFKHNFGLPSCFFILDLYKMLPSLNVVRNYNLPISGFITHNMNFEQYDYPFFISNWSSSCIYLNYLIVLQLVFFGLQKKKLLFWHFFIKYQIIYILKKKLLDLS